MEARAKALKHFLGDVPIIFNNVNVEDFIKHLEKDNSSLARDSKLFLEAVDIAIKEERERAIKILEDILDSTRKVYNLHISKNPTTEKANKVKRFVQDGIELAIINAIDKVKSSYTRH